MTDAYLIDRLPRLEAVLEALARADGAAHRPLGVGFFTCRRNQSPDPETARGTHFEASPPFLREALLSEILAGRQSPLSQDVLLYGTPGQQSPLGRAPSGGADKAFNTRRATSTLGASGGLEACLGLRSWLTVGLLPLRDLTNEGIPLSPLNESLIETGRTLSEATGKLMGSLLHRAEDLGASVVVIPVDSLLLVEFMYEIVGPMEFGLGRGNGDQVPCFGNLAASDQELCLHFVAEELMRCCAELWSGHHRHLVFLCDTTARLESMISVSRSARSKVTNENGMYVRI